MDPRTAVGSRARSRSPYVPEDKKAMLKIIKEMKENMDKFTMETTAIDIYGELCRLQRDLRRGENSMQDDDPENPKERYDRLVIRYHGLVVN